MFLRHLTALDLDACASYNSNVGKDEVPQVQDAARHAAGVLFFSLHPIAVYPCDQCEQDSCSSCISPLCL